MKMRSKFSSLPLEIYVITLITGFLLYNLIIFFQSNALMILLPISIQATLVVLLFTKHRYLATGIKIWALFFIVSGTLRISQVALQGIAGSPDTNILIWGGIKLVVGIILYLVASKEIEVIVEVKKPAEQ